MRKKEKQIEIINESEFYFYESFLQYGNLEHAKYIFVGREEGLNRQSVRDNHNGRLKWIEKIPHHIKLVNGNEINDENIKEGFYIDDSLVAGWIREHSEIEFDDYKEMVFRGKKSPVLKEEVRIILLLKKGYDILNKSNLDLKDLVDDYFVNYLFRKNDNTAMLDYYGLPKQDNKIFLYKNKNNQGFSDHRKHVLTKAYNTFPMPINIVFTGLSKKKYTAKEFYEQLGFELFELDTSMVHSDYTDAVKPSPKPKKFLKGKRIRPDGHVQYVFLTPFIGISGLYNCSQADINVVTTWIRSIDNK